MEKIIAKHFKIFNPLSIFFKQKLEELSLSYKKPTNKERDVLINEIVEFLNKKNTVVSGKTMADDNGYYLGEVKAFKRHGYGKYYFNSGSIYDGFWKNLVSKVSC